MIAAFMFGMACGISIGFGLAMVRRREIGAAQAEPTDPGPPPTTPHLRGYYGPGDPATRLRVFVAEGVAS